MNEKELLFVTDLRDLLSKYQVNISPLDGEIFVYGAGIDIMSTEGTTITPDELTKTIKREAKVNERRNES